MTIYLADQSVELRPSGAALVGDALVVADLHLGKERAFRQQGLPVPEGPTAATLARLADEISATRAQRLIFLGDLFHHGNAIAGSTFDFLQGWLSHRSGVDSVLVKGNHDRIPPALEGIIATVPTLATGELQLFHHPQDPEIAHLAGHLHPAVRISDGPDSARLRCFWRCGNRLVLPSFSTFTGCHVIGRSSGDQVFVAVGSSVRRLFF